jgi:hypothetical protein
MSAPGKIVAERVEKIMALTPAEFASCIRVLLPAWDGTDPVAIPWGSGRVSVRFEPLPPVRLGGVLELPRARITIAFDGLGCEERAAFLGRFDIAFSARRRLTGTGASSLPGALSTHVCR